ncbi:uncharacterized protein LOC124395797 isoform X2 [Silurus meridionalis]|uniref:uncharacterized protein LOC124395797 isoform X2 n=1 Tax=Silurus meridionalis TaxID=175797 RepID=UPI001EEA2F47|nr:uncharacterized protein LOC124395797 isoform X2 [Silurus meridionalis]
MEECALLVCEALGVHMGEEVSVEKILSLYQDVYHTAAELRDTQRAVTKVRSQNGGLPCSGRWILYVLLEMEKERENREKLLWELQMLKSGVGGVSDTINTQPLSTHTNSKYNKNRDKKPCGLSGLLRRARKLCVRLDDDGIWSILPSPSLDHVTSRRLCLINPTKADVLLLQQYKYDIIKERLYREMLQEEHGAGWWELMDPLEQSDCVCDVEQRAEEAFQLNDVLRMCELPRAFNCYRSGDKVLLHSCPDEVGVTEQAWTSSTSGQSWTSIIFLSVLRCHCEEERRALTQLLNRVERLVLIEIYLSVFVSVRRIERETHTHTALLTARQHWDNKWPYTRRLDVEELGKFWLQEKQTPVSDLRDESRTSRCVWQAVLQFVVLCQEKERRTLLEILHSVSQEELQEERHTLRPVHKMTGSALRQGCVSLLRQMKSSLQCSSSKSSVSWAKCAVHLLTQLTHTQDLEVQTLIHTLPAMDSAALMDLLHKYELEVHSPKLHNLHNLLQTSNSKNTHIAISAPDSERTEQKHKTPSHCEEQEICTGCGVVLVPEDTPYLEILGVGEKRDEERRKGGEEEEEEREKETLRKIRSEMEEQKKKKGYAEDKLEKKRKRRKSGKSGREER